MTKARSGVEDFSFHDLRRTFRTGLTALGVEETVGELMIAHQRPALLRIYDKEKQWALRIDAQSRWEEHLLNLTRPPANEAGNVVGIGKNRKRAA